MWRGPAPGGWGGPPCCCCFPRLVGGAGDECGGARPRPASEVSSSVPGFLSLGSWSRCPRPPRAFELSCPLDDQLASRLDWAGIVLHTDETLPTLVAELAGPLAMASGHGCVVHSMANRQLLRGFCHLSSGTPIPAMAPLQTNAAPAIAAPTPRVTAMVPPWSSSGRNGPTVVLQRPRMGRPRGIPARDGASTGVHYGDVASVGPAPFASSKRAFPGRGGLGSVTGQARVTAVMAARRTARRKRPCAIRS